MMTESQDITYRTKVALVIRAARTALGWSQEELAKRASVSKPTIARIEMSGISPRADTLNTLMQVFKAQGVEVEMGDSEVLIKYKSSALLTLQNHLGAK
jgi:transcriptional regulator with XRE-family HTH domain